MHVMRGFPDLAGTPVKPREDFESVELELAIEVVPMLLLILGNELALFVEVVG